VIQDERFGNEILARAGPSSHYQHPNYRTQEGRKKKIISIRFQTKF